MQDELFTNAERGMDSLPEALRPVFELYLRLLREQLPDCLSGFYVIGSTALGEYRPGKSDVDFVAVLRRPLSPADLALLRGIHREIERAFPKSNLSGGYIPGADVGKPAGQIAAHPQIHDGRFRPAGQADLNDIAWWTLKYYGITLMGPDADTLPIEIDWETLRADLLENLNTYWRSWTCRLDAFLVLFSDWGVEWTVLGVLRQYYTFRENDITTKARAGRYALEHLSPRWLPLVREAVRIRDAEPPRSAYRSRLKRMMEVQQFLRMIIAECNQKFG